MDRKFIFCFVIGLVCLYQPAKTNVIRNEVFDFESQVDESLAEPFKKIKRLEGLPKMTDSTTSDPSQEQVLVAAAIRIEEFIAEIKSFYINLKAESVKSGVLPDMNKNLFESKLLELVPKYLDLFYTDVVAIVLNEPRLYDDEKLTILNETLSIFEIIKSDIIPPFKKEIADHPQEWNRLGLLGLFFRREEVDESQLSPSEMAAERRYYDIVSLYHLSYTTHARELETALRKFYKRVREQKENQLLDTEEQNNKV